MVEASDGAPIAHRVWLHIDGGFCTGDAHAGRQD
jgi:hypothetical protein